MKLVLDAFGGESCGQKATSYGLLAVPLDAVSRVVEMITAIKTRFGGSASFRLHCRELFAPDARANGNWAHLTMVKVFELYGEVANGIKELGGLRIAGVAIKRQLPRELPSAPMRDLAGNVGRFTKRVPLRDKQISVFCAWAAFGQLLHKHRDADVPFWADRDSTAIEWFDGRRQATRAITPFFFDDGGGEEPLSVVPNAISDRELPLLEVADLIAFVAQRTALQDHSRNGICFQKLSEQVGTIVAQFAEAPDGGLGVRVSD